MLWVKKPIFRAIADVRQLRQCLDTLPDVKEHRPDVAAVMEVAGPFARWPGAVSAHHAADALNHFTQVAQVLHGGTCGMVGEPVSKFS